MSYHRKLQENKLKQRSFTAKNDFNRGGFHGKPHKVKRHQLNTVLDNIDKDNLDEIEQYDELWEQ